MEGARILLVPPGRHLRARLPGPLRRRRACATSSPRGRAGEARTPIHLGEFLRRNNDELVAGWGNLVNRSLSMAAKNVGSIPERGELTDADRSLLTTVESGFGSVGDLLARSRQKAALGEAMRVVGEANKYISDQAPWKLRTEDPARMQTVLHVALQAVSDCNTLLTPFLPHSAQQVHEQLGGTGTWSVMPEIREVSEEGNADYPVLMGDYDTGGRWESRPIVPGTPLAAPTPIFRKLDPSVVDEELARLEEPAARDVAANRTRPADSPAGRRGPHPRPDPPAGARAARRRGRRQPLSSRHRRRRPASGRRRRRGPPRRG
jgi:hypothetical protein